MIVGAASGGFHGAIILYETALGIGIALGPLVGGELGGISWRGPFFGVTVLMTIALAATLAFVEPTPKAPRRTSITEPLKALRHRGLATMSITALGYNWGFFTLLAYTPFPMHLGIHQLGYVFTGWGIMVAIFAVFAAPRLQARFGTPRTLYVNLALLSADLVVIAAFTSSQLILVVAVIVSGAFVGLNNTLTTQAVMLIAPVERPVASAAYGFVRSIGGGLAPFCASKLAEGFNVHVPVYLSTTVAAAAPAAASPFRQPKAVWAVAFACVVSFMGIGLVDPILPALSKQLKASPSSVELLFTSYLVVTAVAMLVTGWVSSRIGGKRTLVAGLILIVTFSAAAGAAGSIGGIIGFRAGWGLGNALFIATSLAVIVGAASGGFHGAIILYETALGIGIALGPLVGGELGGISWRGPFFGVTVLMTIALAATLAFVEPTPKAPRRTSITEPLKALRHRGLATMSITALGYNWGFFTLLAYTPFPMHLGIHQLGYVFTGWGIMVAIFAVFAAPRLQARFGTPRTLYVNLALLSADLVVIAAFTSSQLILVVAVIVSGAFVGLNNTLTTQAVMLIAPVERPVASAAYGFVRFIGGGLAPFCASKLAEGFNVHVPFYLGAATVAAAIGVLATGHAELTRAEHRQPEPAAQPVGQPLTQPALVTDQT